MDLIAVLDSTTLFSLFVISNLSFLSASRLVSLLLLGMVWVVCNQSGGNCATLGNLNNNATNLHLSTAKHSVFLACRYTVPVESATKFEEELKKLHGPGALMSLTTKHMFCTLSVSRLQELGVKRFVQMPGYAVLTYPVSHVPTMGVFINILRNAIMCLSLSNLEP